MKMYQFQVNPNFDTDIEVTHEQIIRKDLLMVEKNVLQLKRKFVI